MSWVPGREGVALGVGAGAGALGSASPADCLLGKGNCQAPSCCALHMLLQEEPPDHLGTAVRQQAMLTIASTRYLSQSHAWPLLCHTAQTAPVPAGRHPLSWRSLLHPRPGSEWGRQQGWGAAGLSPQWQGQEMVRESGTASQAYPLPWVGIMEGGTASLQGCPTWCKDQPRSPTLGCASSLPRNEGTAASCRV